MKYGYTVYDRDGGVFAFGVCQTEDEADEAAEFHIDDPRYGSHEVEEVDDE